MVRLRKGPVCPATLIDGTPCDVRVHRLGDRCPTCLHRLATSPDVKTRIQVAGDRDLVSRLFAVLATDGDRGVRLVIAKRTDCPLVALQRLEADEDAEVRAAAATSLSAALEPRILSESAREGLFSDADLHTLDRPPQPGPADDSGFGDAYFPVEPGLGVRTPRRDQRPDAPAPRPSGDRIRRVPTAARVPTAGRVPTSARAATPNRVARQAIRRTDQSPARMGDPSPARTGDPTPERISVFSAGFDEVLDRLQSLGERLSSLESTLASTGDRISVIGQHLDQLSDADMAPALSRFVGIEPAARTPLAHVTAALAAKIGSIGLRPSRPARLPVILTRPALHAGSGSANRAAGDDMLPVLYVSALDAGAQAPADLGVAAAWMVVVPLLLRRQRFGRGRLLGPPAAGCSPVRGAGDRIGGPLLAPVVHSPAALPAAPVVLQLNAAPVLPTLMPGEPISPGPASDHREPGGGSGQAGAAVVAGGRPLADHGGGGTASVGRSRRRFRKGHKPRRR